MNFDLRHLEGFVAVAEELHFGRAAERLRIAQPALSQQIQRLEASLGVELLVRERRRTRLSDVGELFLVEARRTLAQAETARSVARRAQRGELGRLRVGYTPSTSSGAFLAMLAGFRERYSDVQVELSELAQGGRSQPLDDDVVDVAFVARLGLFPCSPGLGSRELSVEPFVAALRADHPLAARPTLDLAELSDEGFVVLEPQGCAEWHETLNEMCRLAGFAPHIAHQVGELSTQLMIVAAGLGVALVPASTRALRGEGVSFVPLTGPTTQITSAVLWRSNDRSPVLRRFIECLNPATEAFHPIREPIPQH
ncbi:LysR substrate-binding domain-containing protein [Sphaerisporangium sp. TRM90804]|uniref:LysR substrate-binding domain-containing protein n=1 Tax=Sphaerisporangium sp. TRM90804 TaxID=3031113 RepID=UPI002446FE43|nr:LysR substrate-binding domain-containing protein [Sphaerisporangium sp. TRM90804]MDH2427556.1 LysR substrate-binding domain-containing protein [Sphaerisporangium sp. TRM90804]